MSNLKTYKICGAAITTEVNVYDNSDKPLLTINVEKFSDSDLSDRDTLRRSAENQLLHAIYYHLRHSHGAGALEEECKVYASCRAVPKSQGSGICSLLFTGIHTMLRGFDAEKIDAVLTRLQEKTNGQGPQALVEPYEREMAEQATAGAANAVMDRLTPLVAAAGLDPAQLKVISGAVHKGLVADHLAKHSVG